MDRIYKDADDKNVEAIVLYTSKEHAKEVQGNEISLLFYDKDCTDPVMTNEELKTIYHKGLEVHMSFEPEEGVMVNNCSKVMGYTGSDIELIFMCVAMGQPIMCVAKETYGDEPGDSTPT